MIDSEKLLTCFRGNRAAVELAFYIAKVADTWDNLIDRDKEVDDSEINRAFWMCLVDIPRNQFYMAHFNDLQPIIAQSIINYGISNVYQGDSGLLETKDEALALAHVLRYSVADVIVHMAFIVGGADWAAGVGPELRAMCQRDTLANFMAEMEAKRNV
mgnify:CR=1 FL=1